MFFAALAQVHSGLEPNEGDGFVIVTTASDSGLVDIHDRRPVVLSPDEARKWVEPGLSRDHAEFILLENCRPTADFEWHEVDKSVGNIRNQGRDLIRSKIS